MAEDLGKHIENLQNYGNKPIGIFGARASGKTMFFTVLFGLSGFKDDKQKFSILCKDDETRKYLSKNYTYISNGELLPRTEINDITKIVLNYFYNDSNYNLRSFDFAGELLAENIKADEAIMNVFKKKQKALYDFFSNCSALLIFLEPNDDPKETFARQSEIDKLLGIIQEEKGSWLKTLPIALVITKWDKVSTSPSLVDPAQEEIQALEYVLNHRVYKNIYNLVNGTSKNVKVFPVSAFGQSKEGDLPPDELTNPFNIFSPLVWVSQIRDREWVNKIKEAFNYKIPKKDAELIIKDFKENVENPDLREEAEKEYKHFLKKGRGLKIAIASIIIVALLGAGGYFGFNTFTKSNNYKAALDEKDFLKKIEKIDKYIALYGDNSEESKNLLEMKQEIALAAIDLESDKSKKLALINDLLNETTDPAKRNTILEKQKKVENQIATSQKLADLDKKAAADYNILQDKLAKDFDSFTKYKLEKEFVTAYPDFKATTTLKDDMTKLLKLADREKYKEIEKFFKSNSNQVFVKIEEYLAVEGFKDYRKEVLDMRDALKEENLYNLVQESLTKYNRSLNRETLKELIVACENYNSSNTKGKYSSKVKSIISQTKAVQKGIESELEFFISGKEDYLIGKSVDIKIVVGNNVEYLTKDSVSFVATDGVYLGSMIYDNIGIDTEVFITLYVVDSNGNEDKYGPVPLKLANMNSNKKFAKNKNDLGVKILAEKSNYRIK